jgi:H+/Cl- antiporter ClcA
MINKLPNFSVSLILKVVVVAIACAVVSILFCITLHKIEQKMSELIKNPYKRIFVGGLIVVLLTILLRTNDYNGAGMDIIQKAFRGQVVPYAFLLKILFTAITIGAGFKGGEIVPTFFVGATLGCLLGNLLGIPQGLGAAIGLISLFCGMVNTPIASIFLSIELFGEVGLVYFAIAVGVSYMLSGYYGLYSSQKIVYSKLKAEYINKSAE